MEPGVVQEHHFLSHSLLFLQQWCHGKYYRWTALVIFFFKPHISFNDLGSVLSTAIRVLGGRVCADSAPLWDVGVNNDGLAAGSGVRQKSVRGGLCKFDWQNQSGLHQFNANY